MRRLFLFSWLIILCLSAIQGQTSTRATPVKTIFRDLEFEVIKLSYIRTDRAVAILKSIGYVVIEFEPGKDSHAGERQYTPKQSSKFNVNDVKPSELPIIIKLPETESVTLVKEEKSSSKSSKKGAVSVNLGGITLENTTDGEPMQRLLVGYNRDKFDDVAQLLDLIHNKIDLPAEQILIEALVIELDSDKLDELGIDYSGTGAGFSASFPPPDSETGEINPFTVILDRTLLGNANTFRTNVEALISTKAAEILSKPSVLVLDGRQARIQVGQQIPIVKTTDTQISQTKSVDYIPVGIVLNLRPRINEDDTRITIQVETIISETEQRIGASSGGGVLEAPVINNRRVQSFVRVANNTPFIIGGLISNKKSQSEGGIPILKDLPFLGKIFSVSSERSIKKEVIVVITPHIIQESENNFSRVIPQDSELFNAFGNRSFPNSYRVQNTDVFDLSFIYNSPIFQKIQAGVVEAAKQDKAMYVEEPYKSVLEGRVFGEEILVRRMIYEIIEKMDYYKHIDPEKVMFFHNEANNPAGFKVEPLAGYIRRVLNMKDEKYLRLSYSIHGEASLDKPFVRPTAIVAYDDIDLKYNYKKMIRIKNKRGNDSSEDSFTILISKEKHERRLYEILVMKKVLELNPDLSLQLDYFKPGIEILFPSPEVLIKDFHIVDRDAAKYFYEVNDYYGAFEDVFNQKTSEFVDLMIK
jgi:Flp pilus assembly secretin CpaC